MSEATCKQASVGPLQQQLNIVASCPMAYILRPLLVDTMEFTMFPIRMHCRRLTRLTNGFSKKLENFQAAMDLYFCFYNFVRFHRTLKMTPAMSAGVVNGALTDQNLVEMAS